MLRCVLCCWTSSELEIEVGEEVGEAGGEFDSLCERPKLLQGKDSRRPTTDGDTCKRGNALGNELQTWIYSKVVSPSVAISHVLSYRSLASGTPKSLYYSIKVSVT